eukprot:g486.t1
MFFFFIGGASTRRIILESGILCRICHLPTAERVRYDTVANVFFIPIWTMRRGESIIECSNCNSFRNCGRCGAVLAPSFKFCPYCGGSSGAISSGL